MAPTFLALAALLLTAQPEGAASPTLSEQRFEVLDPARGKRVPLWVLTPVKREGPAPVVLFSHGANGRPESFGLFLRALAGAGYVVVCPTHDDSIAAPRVADRSPTTWGDITFGVAGESAWRDRVRDLSAALDALPKIDRRTGVASDPRKVAVAGYGLGASTALIAGGARPVWRGREISLADPRFRAIIALAPSRSMGLTEGSYRSISIPLLIATHTDRTVFEQGPEQSFLLTLETGPTWTWPSTDSPSEAAPIFTRVGGTFLDAFLKGDPGQKDLFVAGSIIAPVRAKASLEGK